MVLPGTLKWYNQQVQRFFHWQERLGSLPESAAELDQVVCDYLEALWEDGEPKGWADDLLIGLGVHLPRLAKLGAAWKLFGAWARLEMPCRAAPMGELMMCAFVGCAMAEGEISFAVATILGTTAS